MVFPGVRLRFASDNAIYTYIEIMFWATSQSILRATSKLPITWQGFILLLGAFFLLVQVAIPYSDLIAYSISGGLLILSAFSLVSALIAFILNKKTMSLQLILPASEAIANELICFRLIVKKTRLLVFSRIELRAIVSPSPIAANIHVINGSRRENWTINDCINFPHRGIWSINHYLVSVSDIFGLFKFSWPISVNQSIEIFAPRFTIQALPLLALEHSSGENLYTDRIPTGDYYDLRQYNPTDGAKHLLWKTFARSRQLVVRKPEQAGFPDRAVAVYIMARRTDDCVVGAYRSWASSLLADDIQLLFGTDGQVENDLQFSSFVTEEDILSSLHTLNALAWDQDTGLGKSMSLFLSWVRKHSSTITSVILFGAEDNSSNIWQALQVINSYGLKSIVVVVPRALSASIRNEDFSGFWLHLKRFSPFSRIARANHIPAETHSTQSLTAIASEVHRCKRVS